MNLTGVLVGFDIGVTAFCSFVSVCTETCMLRLTLCPQRSLAYPPYIRAPHPLCSQFIKCGGRRQHWLLRSQLRQIQDERIEQLASEKERLDYERAFALKARQASEARAAYDSFDHSSSAVASAARPLAHSLVRRGMDAGLVQSGGAGAEGGEVSARWAPEGWALASGESGGLSNLSSANCSSAALLGRRGVLLAADEHQIFVSIDTSAGCAAGADDASISDMASDAPPSHGACVTRPSCSACSSACGSACGSQTTCSELMCMTSALDTQPAGCMGVGRGSDETPVLESPSWKPWA